MPAAGDAQAFNQSRQALATQCVAIINEEFDAAWDAVPAPSQDAPMEQEDAVLAAQVAAQEAAAAQAAAAQAAAAQAAPPAAPVANGNASSIITVSSNGNGNGNGNGSQGGGRRRTHRYASNMSWLRRRVNSLSLRNLQREENRLSEEEDHEMPGRGWRRRQTRRHRKRRA